MTTQTEEQVVLEVQEDKDYLFSLIIPCYNPNKQRICRLFDSLTRQNIDKNELEIIVVDDNSDNLEYREELNKYDFNITYTETNTEVHCPGNTRRKGMNFIHGHWVFFCDQDDYFEDDTLFQIKNYILKTQNKPVYVISTIMRRWDEQTEKFTGEYVHQSTWLHGKWYSMDNLIIPYNINFKENLSTHEDVYFNSVILAILFRLNTDWDYLNINTYRWVDNPDSVTRTKVPASKRGYLFDNFEDYLFAAGTPFWEIAIQDGNMNCINQIMMTLLHSYFYYEQAIYYYNSNNYNDIYDLIKKYTFKIIKELNISPIDIINFIYSDPKKYDKVRQQCTTYIGPYVPKTSFMDFINNLIK